MKLSNNIAELADVFFQAAVSLNPKGTIVFIHGFSSTYYIHHEFLKSSLLQDYNYFAVNLPDHEFQGSARKPKHLKISHYTRYVIDQIECRGLGNLVLIGHSMGAGIAISIQHILKDQVKAVVLVSPVNSSVYQCKLGLSYLIFTLCNRSKEIYHLEFADFPSQPYLEYEIQRFLAQKQKFLSIGTRILNPNWLSEIGHYYRMVNVPTLVILGSRDKIIPAKPSKNYFQKLGNAEIQIQMIPNAGHIPFVDHYSEYIQIVQQFLSLL